MVITVRELLFKRFSIRSLAEKTQIVDEGRPRPILRDYVELNGKTVTINQFYDLEMWLTGCDMPNGVYCWTCLLFPCDDLECRSFVADIKDSNMQLKIIEHKKTAFHKSGLIELQVFKKQNSLTVNNHQEKLCDKKRNRAILKQVIDVVCFLAARQSPVSVKANDDLESNFLEGCVQMLQLTRSYGNVSIADAAINLIKTRPIMVTDTVKAIANFMKRAIKKELQLSRNHVCLILSEHSEINAKSRISTVLRYISEGKICEKFVQFTDMDGYKCMNKIEEYFLKFISEFDISSRFLALSCDGAVLPTPHLSDLITWIRRIYPLYYFVPCYFHDFNHVLEQHLSGIPECQLFFKNLQAMLAFFRNNPKLCEIFNNVTHGEIPHSHSINFRMSISQFLRILKLYRKQFARFFWYISKDCEKWDKDDIAKSFGFQHVLEEYQTIFLLEVFFQLFDCVAILSETLSSNSPENVFSKNILDNVRSDLSNMKNDGFENFWTLAITELVTNCKPETLETVGEKETKHLNDVYTNILDCVVKGVKIRFSCAGRLEFLSVFNCEANCKFIMHDYQAEELQEMKAPFLNKELLKVELDILCGKGDIFGGKSVYEVKDFLVEANLESALENVNKLTELILTLPCKPASPQNTGSSKLELMNSWAAVSDKPEIKLLSLLCIEKDFLKYLKSRIEFYDEVISDLKKLNTGVEESF